MHKLRWIIVVMAFLVFAVLVSAAIYLNFKYEQEEQTLTIAMSDKGCVVRLVDNSNVVDVHVVDIEKFQKFVRTYLPCENEVFVVGNPYSHEGPFKFPNATIVVGDLKLDNSVYARNSEGEKVAAHTHQYDLSKEGEAFILMQFTKDVTRLGDFDKLLPLFIASRLSALHKYDYPSLWLDRAENSKNFTLLVGDIGVEYEFK
jgi:hypothetical protein